MKKSLEINWGDSYEEYNPKNYKEYVKFLKLIFKSCDSICFTVSPSLDNLEEFQNSQYSFLKDSVLYVAQDEPIFGGNQYKDDYVILKPDFQVYNFFMSRKGILDFYEEENYEIWLENPIFVKDKKIICGSLTHERGCDVIRYLYDELIK